uniref:Uncharacterized protein n=1 Tax=Anguilla anguilla TaxID=7936 RepID=A0A0E9W727_ANGAN
MNLKFYIEYIFSCVFFPFRFLQMQYILVSLVF